MLNGAWDLALSTYILWIFLWIQANIIKNSNWSHIAAPMNFNFDFQLSNHVQSNGPKRNI